VARKKGFVSHTWLSVDQSFEFGLNFQFSRIYPLSYALSNEFKIIVLVDFSSLSVEHFLLNQSLLLMFLIKVNALVEQNFSAFFRLVIIGSYSLLLKR